MIVVVPYVPGHLHERTVPSIVAQGYRPRLVPVRLPNSYGLLLTMLAAEGADVCVVEHDNESRPGLLAELAACPEPYCWNPYPVCGMAAEQMDTPGLGHTRLRAEAWAELAGRPELAKMRYQGIDSWIARTLAAAGISDHRHDATVLHHH